MKLKSVKLKSTDTSKKVYIEKLDAIVNKYNNTYNKAVIMKPVDVKDNTYIEFGQKSKDKLKFQVSDHIRISKYKSIFAKGYTPNLSGEVSVIEKVKISVPWIYIISDLNGEELVSTFYEKELQKTSQEELKTKKVLYLVLLSL